MRYTIFGIEVFLLALFAFEIQGKSKAKEETDVHAIVSRLEQKYKALESLKVSFTQTITNSRDDKPPLYKGTLYLKKGGKMFWDYKEPKFDIRQMRSNGDTLCMYFPNEKEAMFEDDFDRLKESTGISFLWGEGSLEKQFNVSLKEERDDVFVLSFIPREDDLGIRSMNLTVHKDTNLVREVVTTDVVNNENRIVFGNKPIINPELNSSLFSCSFGKDVTILNAKKNISHEPKEDSSHKSGMQKKSN
jgi:outer membrane lipoprotein-sorting protein